MKNKNHEFCKKLEAEFRKDIGLKMSSFWTHKNKTAGKILFEVHGPDKFYWCGQSCCAWGARADAYDAYERHLRDATSKEDDPPEDDPDQPISYSVIPQPAL